MRSAMQAGFRVARLPILFVICLGAANAAFAADRGLSADGTVHAVVVENRPTKGANSGGTRLVHKVQSTAEAAQNTYIPGTDEPVADNDPSISLSPNTGLPALVWTRNESGDLEVYFSVYDGARWSTPRAVTANNFDDRKPQILWGRSDYIHLMWSGPGGSDGYPTTYEAILDPHSLTVLPPTLVLLPVLGTVTPSGPLPEPVLSNDSVIFAIDTGTKNNPRVSVYGGYDEPIPVIHRIDLILPAGASLVENAKIQQVESSRVVFVKSGLKLFYTIESPTAWTPLRSIVLDTTLTQDKAELIVRDMIIRNAVP